MEISPPTKVIHRKTFTLKCNASIVQSNLAQGLMQYANLEWVGPDGGVMTSNNDIIISGTNVQNNLTSTLMFNPMIFSHEGEYICRSKFDFPAGETALYNQTSTRIDVTGKNLIKCSFQH